MNKFLNKIIHGDCLEVMKEIPDESIDLIVTDPPYGIDYISGRYKEGNPFGEIKGDDMISPEWLDECLRILKNESAIYLFTRFDVYPEWLDEVQKRFTFKNTIIWVKNNHTAGDLEGNYSYIYEMLIFATKGKHKLLGKRQSNVWYADRVYEGIHPTQKPIPLYERAIQASSRGGALYWILLQA